MVRGRIMVNQNKEYYLGLYEKSMPNTLSWEEKLKVVKEAGFDYLEMSIDETEEKLARLDQPVDEIKKAIEKTGVPIKSICLSGHRKYPLGSHDPKIRERGMEIMEKAICLAARLGVRVIQLAGYDVYYGGKSHLTTRAGNNTGDTAPYGFPERFSRDEHAALGKKAAQLLTSLHAKGDKPFLMVASFINPHDICDYHVLIKPEGDRERVQKLPRMDATLRYIREITSRYTGPELYGEILPPLPLNHELTADAPEGAVPGPKPKYTPEHWQMHQWIYGKLTEDVDGDIAPIIEVLRKKEMLENTIVVFVSDHGDLQGAHRREMKMAPYQEAQLVPFVFTGCGIQQGKLDRTNVVNSGIDLLPTLCDLAGIKIPAGMPGHSLEPVLTGKSLDLNRKHIFCEGPNWFQVIQDGRYKYTIFEAKDHPDMLIDLETDPGEMQNLSNNPDYRALRDELRGMLMKQLEKRGIVLRDNVRRPTI